MQLLSKTFYAFSIVLLLSVAGLFLASMLPIPGNIEIKIVKSGSMEPTIPTGSLVVIKPVETYALRDVITFGEDTRTQIPTTHRIVATREENGTLFSTKGDANEDPDTKEIRGAEIIGKVVMHAPYAGFVLDFAKKPVGFFLLIGIPAATIIIDELINIFREVRAAWRRRNRDGGGRGGSSFDEHTESHVVFTRRFSMDDISVPLRVLRVRVTRRLVSQRQYVNASASMIAVFAVISLSSGGTASTLSYFRDTESSAQNIFGAGEWSPPLQPLMIDEPDNTARFFSATLQQDDAGDDQDSASEQDLEQDTDPADATVQGEPLNSMPEELPQEPITPEPPADKPTAEPSSPVEPIAVPEVATEPMITPDPVVFPEPSAVPETAITAYPPPTE